MQVLTYNVSWKSMVGYHDWKLCNSTDKKNTKYYGVCQNNILKVIDSVSFDVIALQEAANYKMLVKKSKTLDKLDFIHHKSGLEDMVTFYSNKLKLISYRVGEFELHRPWQILFFTDFCFVNLHCGHYSEVVFKNKIKDLLDKINKYYSGRIILAGDFNYQIGSSLKIGPYNLHGSTQVIKTCCYNNYSYQTDYILDTFDLIKTKTIDTHLASDHKPIIGIIKNNH